MIKKEDIEKLAELSRMEVTDEEVKKFSKDIDSILDYVKELTQIATEEIDMPKNALRNVMREDEKPHKTGLYSEALLSAAPEREGNYFKVKKILE